MALPENCAVCGRYPAVLHEFPLIAFADARPRPARDDHAPGPQIGSGMWWFCPDHEASARTLAHLTLTQAVKILLDRDREAKRPWWRRGRARRRSG